MWLLLLIAAAPPQTLRVVVATTVPRPGLVVEVRTTWLGEERKMRLTDDGSQPGDVAMDGLYSGVWTGEAVRMLPIQLVQPSDSSDWVLYEGLERVYQPSDTLSYALTSDSPPRALRVVAPYVAQRVEMRETSWVAASIGWAALVFVYVAWLVGRAWPLRRS